jgi:hypothetical protein
VASLTGIAQTAGNLPYAWESKAGDRIETSLSCLGGP